MKRFAAVATVVAAVLLGTAGPATAHADEDPIGVIVGGEDGTRTPAVRIADLYPTARRQVVFLLDDDAPADTRRMRFGVDNLADQENGCGDPEIREGDTSCGGGDGAGELSGLLELTLTAGRQDGGACSAVGTPLRTTLRRLADEPAVVGLPAGSDTLCVITDLRHGEGVGDDVTQSDSARFDLRIDVDPRPVAVSASVPGIGEVTIRPARIESGSSIDLGAAPDRIPLAVPLLLGGVACGAGALAMFVAFRRGSGVAP